MSQLLILNYHDILPKDVDHLTNEFNIEYSQFIEHLDLIERTNIPIIRLSDWKETNSSDNLLIALTFDDGYKSHYNSVYPVLQERNIQAAFFPIVSAIEQLGYMTWTDLQEINDSNHEIGSHGYTHMRLAYLSDRQLKTEIVKSKELLNQKLNQPVTHFALPYGVYTQKILRQIAHVDYGTVLTTDSKINMECSSFVLHRFNIKNTMDINHLLQLLNCETATLKKIKRLSRAGLTYNRLASMVNLIN